MEAGKKLNTIWAINASFQPINGIGKKTKDKHRRKIGHLYWTRYMTRTNLRHLFRNKGNFIYNNKPKKWEHMSETPLRGYFKHIQWIKSDLCKHALK